MVSRGHDRSRPSVRELRHNIRYVKGLDLRRADLDYLKSKLLPIVGGYVHASPVVGVGELVFRAVPWEHRPVHKKDLSYPPAFKVRTYQRANRPGEPMFYGSVGSSATILELAPSTGTRLAISTWRVNKELYVVDFGYTEDNFRRLKSDRWRQVWWAKSRKNGPESTSANQLVHEFLSREFTRKVPRGAEWQYKLSVAVSEISLKAHSFRGTRPSWVPDDIVGIRFNGVVYPSVATNAAADNIALTCDSADECLDFVAVHYRSFKEGSAEQWVRHEGARFFQQRVGIR